MERLGEFQGKGRLDAVVVYGICPKVLEQAPGSREHAKMVPKMFFKDLSLEDEDGSFYLRTDAILGIFVVDSAEQPPVMNIVARQDLANEERREAAVGEELERVEEELRAHSRRVAQGLDVSPSDKKLWIWIWTRRGQFRFRLRCFPFGRCGGCARTR